MAELSEGYLLFRPQPEPRSIAWCRQGREYPIHSFFTSLSCARMNISNARSEYHQTNPFQLKLFKKGIFWILLNEESFFIAKYFSLKITPHDKQHVKVGFPLSSQKRWLGELEKHGLGYVLIDKYQTPDGETKRKIIDQIPGKYYNTLLQINLQEYELTRQRIL